MTRHSRRNPSISRPGRERHCREQFDTSWVTHEEIMALRLGESSPEDFSRRLFGKTIAELQYDDFAYVELMTHFDFPQNDKPVKAQGFILTSSDKWDDRYGITREEYEQLVPREAEQLDDIRDAAWQWSYGCAEPYSTGEPMRNLWLNAKLRKTIGKRFAVLHRERLDGGIFPEVQKLLNKMKSI